MEFYTLRSGGPLGGLYKFSLAFRLSLALSLLGLLQVSAAGYGQQLRMHKRGVTVMEVFRTIKSQTGYDVLWQRGQLDAAHRINADFNGAPLDQVMAACLLGQGLSYTLEERSIVLRKTPAVAGGPVNVLRQDSVLFTGKVTDENNKPMAGASVRIKYGSRMAVTGAGGEFRLYAPRGESVLQVSFVGYAIKELPLNTAIGRRLSVQLLPATGTLSEVQVVSDGYQELAKERATGSFEVVTAKQLEHSTDPNLLKRLEGITTSMNFNNNNTFNTTVSGSSTSIANKNRNPLADLTIRGKNTLTSSTNPFNNSGFPLLVIDGIASAYSIDQLNPEDIESVTILKDAASASIWGSRAANGVLVVKTKRGNYQQPVAVSLTTNFSVTEKPDLFYRDKMTPSDFIDAQRERFIRERTNLSAPVAGTSQAAQSPVAEIMNDYLNRGVITEAQANAQLDALRGNDVRRDITKYLMREPFIQNYSLGVSGGSKGIAYRLSAGYSNSEGNTRHSGSDRLNLGYSASVRPLKGLELSWNANYILQRRDFQTNNTFVGTEVSQFQPYAQLADAEGNALAIPRYRPAFVELLRTTYGSRLLDMTYKPLEEMGLGSLKGKSQGMNLLVNANYRFDPSLSATLSYSYNRLLRDEEEYYSRDSYYLRELNNRFTDPGTLVRGLPYGDILVPLRAQSTGQTLRGQLNYSHTWSGKHALNAIAGMDVSQNYTYQSNTTYLGYDRDRLTFNNNINRSATYPYLYGVGGSFGAQLPFTETIGDNRNRALSSYANAAYTYNNRYTVSGSVRRDGSNLYGKTENRSGTPFYSTGLSWNIANEHFYHFALVPRLQLRATFGYNGNSNPAVNPKPRLTNIANAAISGLPYSTVPTIGEATNGELRPERTGILNLGLDFGLKGGRLSGSVEYYVKNTKDLIANNLLDPSTGFSNMQFNTGDLRGTGTDLTLNSQNLQLGKFSWSSNFLLSTNRVKVKKLYIAGTPTASLWINSIGTSAYNVGYDLQRMFAYRWAGLDPATGNPRAFLYGQALVIGDGQQGTSNYQALSNASPSTLRYMGSAVPVYFGSLRNSFSYGSLMVSVNILYKMKYFARRPLNDLAYYSRLYTTSPVLLGGEYVRRWRQPGDELVTNVPSLTYPGNIIKDDLYAYSDINVIRADHIRLQEVNLSWGLKRPGLGLKSVRLYANVTNLGILWRANRLGIDPDINDVPNPRGYSFGLSANF
jgi:TonB-linked SusC/RagA family outer membrane protein